MGSTCGRTVEAPQPSFQEDESVQEWNTFLSQRPSDPMRMRAQTNKLGEAQKDHCVYFGDVFTLTALLP